MWKLFALLESSFGVLLSVMTIIYLAFVIMSGDGLVRTLAILGIFLSVALTLVAHGQLIGTFRRRPAPATPQVGSVGIPILIVADFGLAALLWVLGGSAHWTDFARVYLTYSLLPPAALAFLARAGVAWSIRRMVGDARL
ncbi:MAG TPA: hypothetical protein VFZ25_06205 [Chloroflexota bacterium]|nr:hypothetical protein [Chloroflexota bacterium]